MLSICGLRYKTIASRKMSKIHPKGVFTFRGRPDVIRFSISPPSIEIQKEGRIYEKKVYGEVRSRNMVTAVLNSTTSIWLSINATTTIILSYHAEVFFTCPPLYKLRTPLCLPTRIAHYFILQLATVPQPAVRLSEFFFFFFFNVLST